MKPVILVTGLSLGLLVAIFGIAQDIPPDLSRPRRSLNELIAQLRSQNAPQRDAAGRLILAERVILVRELQLTILQGHRKPEQRDVVALAMRLLAELHAEEAVPTLIEALGFPFRAGSRRHDTAPQIEALAEMGLASLDPLVNRVIDSADPMVPERAALVIYGVLGNDMALFYLEDRMRRQKEPLKRERLLQLRREINRLAERGMVPSGPLQPPPRCFGAEGGGVRGRGCGFGKRQ